MSVPIKNDGKKWSWECAYEMHTNAVVDFWKEHWERPVSEKEYVAFYMEHGSSRRRKRRQAKKDYRYLRSAWGFFREKKSLL